MLAARILNDEHFRMHGGPASESEVDDVIASALLHDCVPVAKDSPLRKESARLCSEKAREWLQELQWGGTSESRPGSDDSSTLRRIDGICGAILDHSYSSGRIPSTLTGRALQDADRLEALGALGLFRTIATGVSMGAVLFDPADPWAEHRELDDRRYTIDHFFTKLLKLPETFRTRWARHEAIRRAEYLRGFLDQLRHELGD